MSVKTRQKPPVAAQPTTSSEAIATADMSLESPPLSPLEKARIKRREMVAAGEHVGRIDPLEKARRNPRSLALAVRAKCWECCGAGADGGTRQTIGGCTVRLCPLHPHRPYRDKSAD